jgi:hypothetical protein
MLPVRVGPPAVPNLVFTMGYASASWTLKAEATCTYWVRLLRRMYGIALLALMDDGTHSAHPSPALLRHASRF